MNFNFCSGQLAVTGPLSQQWWGGDAGPLGHRNAEGSTDLNFKGSCGPTPLRSVILCIALALACLLMQACVCGECLGDCVL